MSLLTNLISYWKMDEASGNALDAHGSNDLAETGGTIGSASGKLNGARDLELGDTEWFEIADNTDLSTGDVSFALQVGVNLESKATTQAIAGKWNGTAGQAEYLLYYDAGSDRFTWIVHVGGSNYAVLANTLGSPSTGTWYLIHCWHDSAANEIGIAVNAGSADTQAHSAGVMDSTAAFILGANDAGTVNHFDGLMDEVGFWKGRVLNSSDRSELYNGGNWIPYEDFGGAAGQPTIKRWGGVEFAANPYRFCQGVKGW